MKKKLVRHGNSWALVIDKPIMQLLGITPKTALSLEIAGSELVVKPSNGHSRKERFRRALTKVMKNHDETLRRLAD